MKLRIRLLSELLHDESGFTMLEIAVATVILMLIAIGTLAALVVASQTSASTNGTITVNAVLQREVESVKALGGSAQTVAYHQVVDVPGYGLERIVTANQPQTGLNLVTINVYKDPKADGDKPLTQLILYIRQSGSGL